MLFDDNDMTTIKSCVFFLSVWEVMSVHTLSWQVCVNALDVMNVTDSGIGSYKNM